MKEKQNGKKRTILKNCNFKISFADKSTSKTKLKSLLNELETQNRRNFLKQKLIIPYFIQEQNTKNTHK